MIGKLRALIPFLGLGLFAVVLVVLTHELRAFRIHDVIGVLRSLPGDRVELAILLVVASYALQTTYDALGVRYARHRLPYRRIALTSFIGSAFSNNIGYSLFSGGSVRYRLYSAWGLSTVEITKVVLFCWLTFWIGFTTLAGAVLVIEPLPVAGTVHLPFAATRPLGAVLLLLVAGYVAVSAVRKEPLAVRGWSLELPPTRLAIAQVALASLDWVVSGAALYVLLPPVEGLSLARFIAAYAIAQLAGIVSQVPGGLGVFETVLLLLLTPDVSRPVLLGTLVAFRAFYYLLPLLAAAVLLGVHEVVEQREGVRKATRFFGRWAPQLTPNVLAFTTFIGGAVLLVSGSTPELRGRLALVRDVIPLPLVEVSHFLASLTGAALLVLAWGLQRRLDAAWAMTGVLLAAGMAFSLLKGFDYEEATVLGVTLAALIPSRRAFYRRGSLLHEPLGAGWLAAVTLVLVGSVWLGFFSFKHVEYSSELWWRVAFHADAPRFLRATVGVFSLAVVFAIARLLRATPSRPPRPLREEWDTVRELVRSSPQTSANLALLGDKAVLLGEEGNAFVMYGVEGRSWIAMGDPVARDERSRAEIAWRFRELVDQHDGWTAFYEVSRAHLHLYLDLGLTLLKLGEEARTPLADFSLEGSSRKWLRYVNRKLEKEGVTFEVVPREEVPTHLPALRAISDAWLAEKSTREKGFSLGFFDERYLQQFPLALARRGDEIVGFANVWLGADKEELSVDLMRHTADAPNGVMDFLFSRLMLWGASEGYRWFNLGMVPLAGLHSRTLAPLWHRVGAMVYRHGEHFYNFQGLRQFKEKFEPTWEPRYLASPGGLVLPRVLTAAAVLISRGMKGVVAR